MQLFIHEVIEKAAAAKKVEEKVAILQQYNSMGLRDIIKITYDTRIQWLIPTSEVPYEASEEHNWATNLVKNTKRLMHCIAPNGNQVKPFKRENIFISLLEGIHPKDAELMVNHTLPQKPFKGLTKATIIKAFPNLDIPN